jgi:hypothetical protein
VNLKSLGEFFKSGLGLLVLGFVLTTVCGGILNSVYSWTGWQRDKKFELLKSELVDDQKLLSDLAQIIGKRTFLLQRVVFQMDPPDLPEGTPPPESWSLKPEDQKELKARWDAYYETVKEWNVTYRSFAIKIRGLAGDPMAEKFIASDAKGARKAKAGTLCGEVEETHNIVLKLEKKVLSQAPVGRTEHEQAQQAMDRLYDSGQLFVTDLYETLRKKEQSDNPIRAVHHGR